MNAKPPLKSDPIWLVRLAPSNYKTRDYAPSLRRMSQKMPNARKFVIIS